VSKKYIKDYFLTDIDNYILNTLKTPLKHSKSEILSIIHKNKSKIFSNLYLTTFIIDNKYLLKIIFQDEEIRNYLLEKTSVLDFLITDRSDISNKALNYINDNKKTFLELLESKSFIEKIIRSNNLLNLKDFKSLLFAITDIHEFEYVKKILKKNNKEYLIRYYRDYPKRRDLI